MHTGKRNLIWNSHQCGFPNKSPYDVIRWGIPLQRKLEFLYTNSLYVTLKASVILK